jgi:hypothetical protein
MEGRATAARGKRGAGRRDLALLALLLLGAVALRAWHLAHTEVAARDSIGFIRYAWQLDHHPWTDVIRNPSQAQHPGYPLTILGMSYPVRQFVAGPETRVMQLSAQLATCLASVLLVVPMYFLGRELFHRSVGFWIALVFQCLPAASRALADGLSEGVFLLLTATALFGAVRAFRHHSPRWFAVTGVFGALAYLTRPEGALVVGATGLVLLAVQCVRARRAPWRRFLACGAALGVTAVVLGSPIYLLTGKLTVKPTADRLIQSTVAPAPQAAAGGEACAALPFAVWMMDTGDHTSLWSLRAVAQEFVKGGHYVLWLPMLLGLWWFRDRFRLHPGAWVLVLVGVAVLGLMWRVASLLGYVSDRHLLLPILCGTCWGVAAVPKLVTVSAAALGRLRFPARLRERLPAATSPLWAALLLTAFVGAALPKTLEPLHANRKGFRDAGLWIAEHSRPWDAVMDPYSWSHYYSGKVFLEDESPAPPEGQKKVCYVVIEASGREHVRLLQIQGAMECAARGRKVWEKPSRRRNDVVNVIVYEAPESASCGGGH